MKEGGRPKFSGETGAVEESTCSYSKFIVVYLHSSILGGAIRASRFKGVVEVPEEHVLEDCTTGKLATLVRPNAATVLMAVLCEELL